MTFDELNEAYHQLANEAMPMLRRQQALDQHREFFDKELRELYERLDSRVH